MLIRGILPVTPPLSNCEVPKHFNYHRCRDRNRVERMCGDINQQRRIAGRYDKTTLSPKASSTSPPLVYG